MSKHLEKLGVLPGREEQLGALNEAICDAFTKEWPCIALVEGAPGCGKSAFLEAVVGGIAAATKAVVLSATCSPRERHAQYGALRQLIQACDRPTQARAAYERLDATTLEAMLDEHGTPPWQTAILVHDATFAVFSAIAAEHPLALVLDDVQDIDKASADCLLYVVRRLRSAPVALVVSDTTSLADISTFRHELQLQPHHLSVRLVPLNENDVRLITASRLPSADSARISAACYAATGGNPLLVRAYLDDYGGQVSGVARPCGSGPAFDRAVIRCLQRAPEPVRQLACAMGVLADDGGPRRLARLLGFQQGEVDRAITVLGLSGLLTPDRHLRACVRATVLREMDPQDRAESHERAAKLLYEEGEAPRLLAHHLIAAQSSASAWSVPTLQDAALQSAGEGDTYFAERCLELASTDERAYGSSKAMLLELAWRSDPAAGDRYVPGLLEALAKRQLPVRDAMTLIRHQLWHGRIPEAVSVVAELRHAPDYAENSDAIRTFHMWLTHAFPPLLSVATSTAGRPGEASIHETLLSSVDLQVTGIRALSEVLTNQPDGQAVANARHVFKSRTPDEFTFITTQSALLTLVYVELTAEAAEHCDRLLAEAARANIRTWHAVLTGIRAEIHRRTGDLAAAAELAQSALDQLPERSWGVPIVQPLTCRLLTMLASGDLAGAAKIVERPLPSATSQSALGLIYQYACGQHQLAAGSPQAALRTFTTCGDVARSWDLDMPTVLPWRGGAAEAHLQLGRPDQARELLTEQLALVEGHYPRVHGATLRGLARTLPPAEACEVLAQALQLVESSGDRLALTHTLHELSLSYGALGESRRARMYEQLARRMAKEGGISVPQDREEKPRPVSWAAKLTGAEQRVAMLAARGLTNREIGEHLFITPSTVEQHLTRTFRKLEVKHRDELPLELGLDSSAAPAQPGPGPVRTMGDAAANWSIRSA